MSAADLFATHDRLALAVRETIRRVGDLWRAKGISLSEWPVERAGCLYAYSVTITRAQSAHEIGECRFIITTRGDTYFDADDAPLAPCPPDQTACEAHLSAFVSRRAQAALAVRAA